ncbi:MAG: type II toxin-antitoxin system VapC family toxin [Anaerolineae bacterium]|nr:type II toxin-antitoxin system VapC family toxin [Anaerolineae bacterium]
MGSIVIDTSVVIKWFVTEPQSVFARIILSQYQTGHIALIAPDVIHAEMANILWRKHQLQRLASADGQVILDTFRALHVTIYPSYDLIDEAYQLAVKFKQSVYAMLYLALGQREHCKYVTADEEFVKAVNSTYPSVIALADWK